MKMKPYCIETYVPFSTETTSNMCTSMQNKLKNARNMNQENGERPQENI